MTDAPLFVEIVLGIVTGGGLLFFAVRMSINRYIKEIDGKHERYEAKFKAIDEKFKSIEPRLQKHYERVDSRLTQIRNDMDGAEQDFNNNIANLNDRITTILTEWPDKFVSQREFDRRSGSIEGKIDEILRQTK